MGTPERIDSYWQFVFQMVIIMEQNAYSRKAVDQ